MRYLAYEKPGETGHITEPKNLFGNPMHPAHLDFFPDYFSHPTRLYRIPHGIYHCKDHVAFTPDYEVVDWHLPFWAVKRNLPPTLCRRRLRRPKPLKGRVLVISAAGTSNNIWHTLFDSIPKIAVAREAGYQVKSFSAIAINQANHSFQKESLVACGVKEEQIFVTDDCNFIQAEELVYVNLGYLNVPQRWAVDFLREIFSDELRDRIGRRRIMISRESARHRRLVGEKQLLELLRGDSFELLRLENLTLREQIRSIADSEAILSPHGAGLANIIWARPGASCIELLPPEFMNICYWLLSEVCGLSYNYAIGEQTLGKSFNHRSVNDMSRGGANIVFANLPALAETIRKTWH
ncbi:MAG: glycosyltransferase family 61 protein [bacterium]